MITVVIFNPGHSMILWFLRFKTWKKWHILVRKHFVQENRQIWQVEKMLLFKWFIPYRLLVNEYKNMFVPTLFHRLPLPDKKFMGYWKIGQPGNAQQKLLCPTETQKIDVKVCLLFLSSSFLCNTLFMYWNVKNLKCSFFRKKSIYKVRSLLPVYVF